MRKLLLSAVIGASLASCAHKLEKAEDLVLNKEYTTIGASKEELRVCKAVVKNIMTVLPTEQGPLPIEVMSDGEEKAVVCGYIDCSMVKADMKNEFACFPMSFLQSPKSE